MNEYMSFAVQEIGLPTPHFGSNGKIGLRRYAKTNIHVLAEWYGGMRWWDEKRPENSWKTHRRTKWRIRRISKRHLSFIRFRRELHA